ncbi:MAG: hypothetical protein IKG93_10810 [Clostridiales bacterium]|nr:hypothetical protein [Clostridiales bacterium]
MKNRYFGTRTGALLLTVGLLLTSCSKAKDTTTEETTATQATATTTEATTAANTTTEQTTTTEETSEASYTLLETRPVIDIPSVTLQDSRYISDEEAAAFEEELRKLPGVVDVKRDKKYKNGQFMVYYEMPLDHKDPSKGTFTQRMYCFYKGKDAPNLFYIGGYFLEFGEFTSNDEINNTVVLEKENPFSERYNCNFFEPEFRLYEPDLDEMNYKNLEYMGYLTDENASEDFHFMIEGLKTIVNGKWAMEGLSKGGQFVAYQLGRYPDDADLYVSESAMIRETRNFPGMYEYCYTTAGDDLFGKETAKKYRDMITELQVELIKHKDNVIKEYFYETKKDKVVFSSDLTQEIMYDCAVLDQVYIWQYVFDDYFENLEQLLKMKDSTDPDEIREYERQLGTHMSCYYSYMQYAVYCQSEFSDFNLSNKLLSLFMFECYREDGNYLYDFSYLREALEKDGSGAKLSVTEDMEESLFELRIHEDQRALFKYDPTVCETRIRAIETSTKPVIIVNATTDVHHVAEIMESDNPNVHIFNVIGACHDQADCGAFFTEKNTNYQKPTQEQKDEYDRIVKEALGI